MFSPTATLNLGTAKLKATVGINNLESVSPETLPKDHYKKKLISKVYDLVWRYV